MKTISSRMSFIMKRVFPVTWFGGMAFFFVLVLLNTGEGGSGTTGPLIFLIMMTIAGYLMMRKMVFDLVDEVVDEGSSLLFRNGSTEVRMDFRDIKNISYSRFSSPARITVSLRNESALGTDLSFSPPGVFHLFKKSAEVEDLIDRVDAARR